MIGSTLVALPFGMAQSGILLGCVVIFIMGGISCYTCTLVVHHGIKPEMPDFTDFIGIYFGTKGKYIGMILSSLVYVGALIAFHILMAQNLFQVGR